MSDRLEDLTAVILVGGLGMRMRPVVADRQKVIAPVAGRPFVMRLLDQLAEAGLRSVVLCTGYKSEQVAETLGEHYRGLHLRYSCEPVALGTAGALRHALPVLDSDPVLAMNGDSFCNVDLAAFWQAHCRQQANGTLVVVEASDTRARGRVTFDDRNEVTNFTEKSGASDGSWISAGIYLLRRALLESIPTGRAVSIERETFPAWVKRGLFAFKTQGKFLDIGTPESYNDAQRLFQ